MTNKKFKETVNRENITFQENKFILRTFFDVTFINLLDTVKRTNTFYVDTVTSFFTTEYFSSHMIFRGLFYSGIVNIKIQICLS